jgi:hypothetical protein
VRNLGELTRGMGGLVSGRLKTIGEYAILVGVFLWCLLAVGFLDFKRYQPPRGTTTLDQLVASLPETLKFAVVEQGGKQYVVWIGRPRGAIVSGPPVYVFDSNGSLVDWVADSGDSDNTFVSGLHVAAFRAPGIPAQEALTYCHRNRTARPG